MSSDTRNADGTFKKGYTANRKGPPPKSRRKVPDTAYNILLDGAFDPIAPDLPPGLFPSDEAAYRVYAAALKGSKRARRTVLDHIRRRDESRVRLSRRRNPMPGIRQLLEPHDPKNIDDALLVLGIAVLDHEAIRHDDRRKRLKLLPWAVQAALGRRHGGQQLTEDEIKQILIGTLDAHEIRWPRGYNVPRRPGQR